MVADKRLCHAESMVLRSPFGSTASAVLCAVLAGGCFGGQSGGEVGEQPAPCACLSEGDRPVRALILQLSGGCAELEVLDVLTQPIANEYLPLETGDVFGGVLVASCNGGSGFAEGDEVLAQFTRGTQSSTTCVEYRACSAERCGELDDAKSTTIDPMCAQAQLDNPAIDCPPQEEWDQAAVAEYDRCDTECLEQTRQACAAHVPEEQLGGTVRVMKWAGSEAHYFWAGEQRSSTLGDLRSPQCNEHLGAQWEAWWSSRTRTSSAGPVAAAPFEEPAILQCPAESAE